MGEPPSFRTALRVTKYDPGLRDQRGAFTEDDWTSVSDVGGIFNGRVLTLSEYLDVENRYLRVVAAFLEAAGVESLVASDVESHGARWWPQEGESLSPLAVVDVVREMLRERGFCRLAGPRGVYVHVGDDYYLYVGGDVDGAAALDAVARAGLFADEFRSPYHVDPASGEYG
jgi:hypothetical protein